MRFVPNGPDIPDSLLQAVEDGEVVFFCGAGISYPAGLPGFRGLVDQIYEGVGTGREPIEDDAYRNGRYDVTLDLLERRVVGRRFAVRKALRKSLQPKWHKKDATATHAALLQLGRHPDGALRLVTTNFDHVFERAAKRERRRIESYAAPMLPVPKKTRWNGLVYLHGLLPKVDDEHALNRLVVTSGDFGLAYLTERWAARFVSDLFRDYAVCFIGYSINDPVMRYMMDALAADRIMGESTPLAWALGDCRKGEEAKTALDWKARGVEPILYELSGVGPPHLALHKTLVEWARTYRDGVSGKERIVLENALGRPSESTRQDDFVGRMIWALSDLSGLPAKAFAEHNPAPALEWLTEALALDRYRRDDLRRFDIEPQPKDDVDVHYSLVRRPAPYTLAPWMTLVSGGEGNPHLDKVMRELARWLLRHLNDARLIIWIAKQGGRVHPYWALLIEDALDEIVRLESEGSAEKLDKIRAQSPSAIPTPAMRALWRVLLAGRVKSLGRDSDLFTWRKRVERDGVTPTARMELCRLLAPVIRIRESYASSISKAGPSDRGDPREAINCELALASDHVRAALGERVAEQLRREHYATILVDVQQLLRDALELRQEIGEANATDDRSHWDLPSIAPHSQNRFHDDWVVLIEILRDGWLEVAVKAPDRARRLAAEWYEVPFPAFKRVVFFAAAENDCIAVGQWVAWLLAEEAWWLWSESTRRECLRLLVRKGSHLGPAERTQLESAIVAGPPRRRYRDDIEPELLEREVDRAVWLRLAKLQLSGAGLGMGAGARLTELSRRYPQWQLAADEKDEFAIWAFDPDDPDVLERVAGEEAPDDRDELAAWLMEGPSEWQTSRIHAWRQKCRVRLIRCVAALCVLSQRKQWPSTPWRVALETWADGELVVRSWRFAAPIVRTLPRELIGELTYILTWWLEAASRTIDKHETTMLELCLRVLDIPLASGAGVTQNGRDLDDPVTSAINHPVGHVTQALLSTWLTLRPGDNELLPQGFAAAFAQLCDTSVDRFRHGRVLLASRAIPLFRVDRAWAERNLLPLFDWRASPTEARCAWEGFLWSPRLYPPLIVSLKEEFLATAGHYTELGAHGRQFASLLVLAGLEGVDDFRREDFRAAFAALSQVGLEAAAHSLGQFLESAGDRREEYWRNRVAPFWHDIWPKSRERLSANISASLVELIVAAGKEFPNALEVVKEWLQPVEHPEYSVHLLHTAGVCSRFPEASLELLDRLIDNQPWPPKDLGPSLEAIAQASPELRLHPRFVRVTTFLRQRGG